MVKNESAGNQGSLAVKSGTSTWRLQGSQPMGKVEKVRIFALVADLVHGDLAHWPSGTQGVASRSMQGSMQCQQGLTWIRGIACMEA